MRRSVWNAATVVVPILIIAVFTPWGAPSDVEFSAGAMKAVVAGVLAFAAIRYGWPLLDREVSKSRMSTQNGSGHKSNLTPWGIAFLGLVGSMALLLLMQSLSGRFGVRAEALLIALVAGQQIVFALAALWIGRVGTSSLRSFAYT